MLTWKTVFPPHALAIRHIAAAPSLTAVLSDLGQGFSVRVEQLGETQTFPHLADLNLPETVFTRRVSLCLNHTVVVRAQSVCDVCSRWRDILHCGNTSLGAVLFSGSLTLSRSEIEFAAPKDAFLVRRSWFEYEGERLYVAECFLEALLDFVVSSKRPAQAV